MARNPEGSNKVSIQQMMATPNTLDGFSSAPTLHPEGPQAETFVRFTAVAEVFPDTELALYAMVAALTDGRYAVWPEVKATRLMCMQPRLFSTVDQALAAQRLLIDDLLRYAWPDEMA